jgi:hypothetical protein
MKFVIDKKYNIGPTKTRCDAMCFWLPTNVQNGKIKMNRTIETDESQQQAIVRTARCQKDDTNIFETNPIK